jgi:hypothetical protein
MQTELLDRRFGVIGARLKLAGPQTGGPRIDIGVDARGEFFDIDFSGAGDAVELDVVDVDRATRHLLLLARRRGQKSKFLCGHDERHWFVAAVPEDARGVTGVAAARAALQPNIIRAAVVKARPKDPLRRRNAAYLRQGEWFFIREPRLDPPDYLVLHREPLTRGRGSKPHILERAYRRGGETVWVNRRYPRGISDAHYRRLSNAERRGRGWIPLARDPKLFAMGAVRHSDHATLVLDGWHRVVMNTEQRASAMQHVVFLD